MRSAHPSSLGAARIAQVVGYPRLLTGLLEAMRALTAVVRLDLLDGRREPAPSAVRRKAAVARFLLVEAFASIPP